MPSQHNHHYIEHDNNNNVVGNDVDIYLDSIVSEHHHADANTDATATAAINDTTEMQTQTSLIVTPSLSKPWKQSGIFGASSNLVNSIVGSGIIGIPYAFKESGIVTGTLLLILVGYMTDISLRIIVGVATFHPKLKHRNVCTYEDLMTYPYGQLGKYFILVNMFIMSYGCMITYLIVIKDTVPVLIGLDNSPAQKNYVMLVTALLIMLPLAMQRDLATLAFSSFLSVFADTALTLVILILSPVLDTIMQAGGIWQVLADNWISPTLFIGLGILSTAMACQHSAFIVAGSLKNFTKTRWAAVTSNSLIFSTLLSLVLGISGYLGFMDDTDSDILNNFATDSVEANTARALLAITMFFTYPMESFVARHVITKLLFGGDIDGPCDDTTGKPRGEFCFGCLTRRHTMTLTIFILTIIPGVAFTSVGTVQSVTGSIAAACLSYIGPGLVYIGINCEDFLRRANASCQKNRSTTAGEAELPLEGTAKQTLQLPHEKTATTSITPSPTVDGFIIEYPSGQKPWWWFLALMPLWCSLAKMGVDQTRGRSECADTLLQEFGASTSANNTQPSTIIEETDPPQIGDYGLAVFFIIFGVVAGIAGITSNIYELF